MYYLKAENSFDSAHFLYGYNGKCANIHGHRWRVVVEVCSDSVQECGQKRGMIVDFSDLKKDLESLTENFDHTLIYESNSMRESTVNALLEEGFSLTKVCFRPTAENLAKYFYDEMTKRGYSVHLATVYETPNNCAAYGERI